MDINFGGVFRSAVSCCRQMEKYNCVGSIVLVGSMSGFIANKGLRTSVYNCSKAAVVQLGRSLAMEWSSKGIRVNVLCPGNIMTPVRLVVVHHDLQANSLSFQMVKKNFEDEPHLKKLWEDENMMGRLSTPEEYRGAALFMLSDASSFMTGTSLIIDGGYTAW
jgi:NAD(P)-dependent dehydrogenase (short-subunit alcohol dehydrogenase family)